MATTKKDISLAVESEPSGTGDAARAASGSGLHFERYFTQKGVSPYDTIEWETRDAIITDEKGAKIFEQKAVEVPKGWSQMATNIVASKYFHGSLETGARERSARQLIGRVVDTMTRWGVDGHYFASTEDAVTFRDELTFLLLNQHASFNSPVWFNCGIEKKPQCSACFINAVDDSLESILTLAKTEGMLFKWGSGTGTQPLQPSAAPRSCSRRRQRLRPALVHERIRRLRRRHQVRRQNPPRGQDGHPQRRPPRHHRVHRVQGSRKSEGLDPHQRRLRRLVRMPRPTPPSSSRTPTTPSASATSSCAPYEKDGEFTPSTRQGRKPVKTYKARGTSCTKSPSPPTSVRRPRHAV